MKIFGIILLIFIVGAFWTVSDYIIPHTWKYKLTVEVETPDGTFTGSAVRKVSARLGIPLFPEERPIHYNLKGEAVVVDMGERGVLFGLIDWHSYNEVKGAFPFSSIDEKEVVNYYDSLEVGKKQTLDRKYWPTMVMFKDIDDPKTVQDFDKGTVISVTAEITNEDITKEVQKYLNWLPTVKKGSLDGRMGTFTTHLSSQLHYGNFIKEE